VVVFPIPLIPVSKYALGNLFNLIELVSFQPLYPGLLIL